MNQFFLLKCPSFNLLMIRLDLDCQTMSCPVYPPWSSELPLYLRLGAAAPLPEQSDTVTPS